MARMALEVPALALPVAMCLYNFFWWDGKVGALCQFGGGKPAAVNFSMQGMFF